MRRSRFPGITSVTGHTDDQPLRSLRFPDNFALSRAGGTGGQPVEDTNPVTMPAASISWVQARPSRASLPPNLPENRARNRRVEITHRKG